VLPRGILFNYRLGYVSGSGDVVTEKLVQLYVTENSEVTMDTPETYKTLSAEDVSANQKVDELVSMADSLHQQAEMEAWKEVESFAEEAREERRRETEIKRQHAERHFEEQINTWQERLETYQARGEQGADMSAPIGNAKQQLDSLRRERDEELAKLEQEQHVTPEEPELVTATFIIP